ncbi:hypothetical protein CSC70_04640 [Pseudoxanthomonas kalamensis DSM 18571]|uniref:hypothetical protein n=1 Tax=Pseudoxanthomonas kalamensis TaxID=289483 RepID=UPI001390F12E|nr:hypothetical protein [Pseudoxanthomonas kalamensis]KAF1711210.1 hypothetical protein CSC70_04640 [Pseudoxanthomonas kalamensis DSM 18571]
MTQRKSFLKPALLALTVLGFATATAAFAQSADKKGTDDKARSAQDDRSQAQKKADRRAANQELAAQRAKSKDESVRAGKEEEEEKDKP